MVQEPCPFQTVISLETALLWTNTGGCFRLRPRCVACGVKQRLTVLLLSKGLGPNNADEDKICDHPSCVKSRFLTTTYCTAHLLFRPNLITLTASVAPRLDQKKLRASIEHIQWTARPLLQEVIRRHNCIRAGKMSQGMLVCLDVEFSAISGKVFEIGVCEFDSGTPLVNVRVKHDCPKGHLHKPSPSPFSNPDLNNKVSICTWVQ
jgi:hypothetical protein